jgi:antitoxin HigA-1
MIPSNRTATHPGKILLHEFLEPMGVSQKAFADHLGVPIQRVNELIRGKRGVTPDTAWLLSEALKTSPQFWLNLQATHDLSANRPQRHIEPLVSAKLWGQG